MIASDENNTVSNHLNEDDRFSCNICLQSLSEPVTTRCGHLFCWSCLYRWLEPGMTAEEQNYLFPNGGGRQLRLTVNPSRRKCPVCKATCTVNNAIPIYVRDCARDHDEREGMGMGHKNEKTVDRNRSQKEKENDTNSILNGEDLSSQDDYTLVNHETESTATTTAEYVDDSISSQTGLRRRRRQQNHTSTSPSSNDENSSVSEVPVQSQSYTSPLTGISPNRSNDDISSHSAIPSRPQPPAPASDDRRTEASLASNYQMTTNNHNHNRLNANVHNRNPLQRALFDTLYDIQSQIDHRRSNDSEGNNSGTDQNQNQHATINIPSLHNRNQNGFENDNIHGARGDDLGYATTDLLSRVLLMLGSFVILVLLVF
mmetsp:Transcript_3714/g.5549  ORF Transcript_3714/g.5549 Transcript_3714/m.5549 type:complete len:372 (+) Transcript_3714:22-1137(+)